MAIQQYHEIATIQYLLKHYFRLPFYLHAHTIYTFIHIDKVDTRKVAMEIHDITTRFA